MITRPALIALALAGLVAPPALAQTPADPINAVPQSRAGSQDPDPIGALLQAMPQQRGADPEEPDTDAAGSRVEAEPSPPAAPQPYAPPPRRPELKAPVYVQETGKNPDAPPGPVETAYDSRIRASMQAAQAYQGPMEGGWSLNAGSRELYVFQLVDHGGAVEGAWRDPRRPGALDASGFIEGVERSGSNLTVRFAAGATATLHPAGAGRWAGELREGGRTETVSLQRRNP